jgi:hypothetical protein
LLCSAYKDGLLLKDGYDSSEQIDDVIKQYSSATISLVSIDKLIPEKELKSGGYHHFVRQFGGEGSPEVDESFSAIDDIPGLQVRYKMADSRDYITFPPLSVGFFQSSSHVVQINQYLVGMLQNGVGNLGTYGSGCSVMDHRGSLLYLGPRKKGHRRQPTVSEGPNEPGIAREYQFGFHRKNMSHKYWPFINGFLNLIVSGTTMAAFYIYPHMAKLFPVSNSVQHRKKFCPSGIIAIDFSSTCHLDKSDDQTPFLESIRTRLLLVVSEFNVLRSKCIDFAEDRFWVANNALQHILWWGVCLPTTCCYQYIGLQTNVKVYRFFVYPGLGTTYQICNYWVHLFLTGLFSHCTSVPIYIVNGRAYFGKCPKVVMFSWGGT